ncbi:hypothetical protein EHE19_006490 [Ruminiclostridium herbifermentans]|uniref:Uncharacterized protein n=1 Tax=Ruminiclostridium herbifermentans TaxID=2488810 RepID=A0A4U7JCX0_9FIRM|nr:hypothetical protein [Ruminiclostridium herbifermentans]QNU68083.1 hypothetical protein EHE19_006490 [Ruminiclostridium herbifermentans]
MNYDYSGYDFYNSVDKISFMNENSTDFRAIFKAVSRFEYNYGKDLSDFSIEEIGGFMKAYEPSTPGAAATVRNCLKNYINYIHAKQGKNKEENPLNKLKEIFNTERNWSDQFVAESQILISHNKLIEIENKLENKQDAIIFRLLFEGIQIAEMVHLTKESISGNTINIENNRLVQVSDRCIEIINEALIEEEYKPLEKSLGSSKGIWGYLKENKEYLIRKTDRVSTENERTSYMFIRSRITDSLIRLKIKGMTSKNIMHSGMIYKSLPLFRDVNKPRLTQNEYSDLAKKFGYYTIGALPYIVNIENAKKLYGNELNIDSKEILRNSVKTGNDDTEKEMFPWWKFKEENGEYGELIVKNYLLNKYGKKNVRKMVDSAGFDFEVKTENIKNCIEVKTIGKYSIYIYYYK